MFELLQFLEKGGLIMWVQGFFLLIALGFVACGDFSWLQFVGLVAVAAILNILAAHHTSRGGADWA